MTNISTGTGTIYLTGPHAAQFNRSDRDNGQAGILAPTSIGWAGSTATALTASQATFVRFVPSRIMNIVGAQFHTSTAAGADDACDVGIYNSDMSSRLASAGATTGKLNGTGVKSVTFTAPVALDAGTVYYAAFSSGTQGGTAGNVLRAAWSGSLAQLFAATTPQSEAFLKATSHPLPTSISTPTATTSAIVLALIEG